MPFLAAITWSPSKYAPACSNWVKSSMVLSARCEPNSRWICTPRSVVVTMRWRDSCGRASGARCVALLVWPFEWQSKHAAPRLFTSPILAVAKARGLFKTGWQVHVVDADGRVFHAEKFDHLLRFDSKPTIKF